METVHLIVSNDDSYNAAVIKRLIRMYQIKRDAIDIFDGKVLEPEQLDEVLYTNSLISNNKAVIVNNAERVKSGIVDQIISFANEPDERILLILVSEDIDTAKKRLSVLNSIKSVSKHILTNPTTYSMLQGYIKEYNIKITRTAIDMLVSALEIPKWGIIENELNKLSIYVGKGNVIDEDAVSELTFNLNKSDTFKFVSEVINCKEESALRSLKKLKETGGDNTMVIGALLWKLRQLVQSNPDKAEQFLKQMDLIYNYTLAIRNGRLGNNIALDMLTIELLHQKSC
ncbi:MAG: DNA polymerase III subunit delta [bacterium]